MPSVHSSSWLHLYLSASTGNLNNETKSRFQSQDLHSKLWSLMLRLCLNTQDHPNVYQHPLSRSSKPRPHYLQKIPWSWLPSIKPSIKSPRRANVFSSDHVNADHGFHALNTEGSLFSPHLKSLRPLWNLSTISWSVTILKHHFTIESSDTLTPTSDSRLIYVTTKHGQSRDRSWCLTKVRNARRSIKIGVTKRTTVSQK